MQESTIYYPLFGGEGPTWRKHYSLKLKLVKINSHHKKRLSYYKKRTWGWRYRFKLDSGLPGRVWVLPMEDLRAKWYSSSSHSTKQASSSGFIFVCFVLMFFLLNSFKQQFLPDRRKLTDSAYLVQTVFHFKFILWHPGFQISVCVCVLVWSEFVLQSLVTSEEAD